MDFNGLWFLKRTLIELVRQGIDKEITRFSFLHKRRQKLDILPCHSAKDTNVTACGRKNNQQWRQFKENSKVPARIVGCIG